MGPQHTILFAVLLVACTRDPITTETNVDGDGSDGESTIGAGTEGGGPVFDGDGDGDGDDGTPGLKFDLAPLADAPLGYCGDGIVDGNEECDTSLPLVSLCPNEPGERTCRADCTWDTTWCHCAAGSPGCACGELDSCPLGYGCQAGVCTALACQEVAGDPCLAVFPCCAAMTCAMVGPNDWACI